MAVSHSSVTVGTTAASLTAGVDDASGNNYDVARRVILTNTGATDVYIGGSGVTTSAYGYKLAASASLALELISGDEPFGIVSTGTAVVRVLHTGV